MSNAILSSKGVNKMLENACSHPKHPIKFQVSVDPSSIDVSTESITPKLEWSHGLGLKPGKDANGASWNVRHVINEMKDFFIQNITKHRLENKIVVPVVDQEGNQIVDVNGIAQFQYAETSFKEVPKKTVDFSKIKIN